MSQPPSENRCRHKDAGNRQCRMIRISDVIPLCPTHARQALAGHDSRRDVAKDLLGPIDDFHTAAAVNHALGRIFILLAGDRISRGQARELTHVCRLLLSSLKEVKRELCDVSNPDWRDEELDRVFKNLPGLDHKLGAPNS